MFITIRYFSSRQTIFAFAVTLGLAGAAHGQVREPTQIKVSTLGVDFRDPKSVAEFDARLHHAAVTACDSGQSRILATVASDQKCAWASWQTAAKAINQPLLSQLHGQMIYLAANH